ncbi:RNA polymerase, sigma-24 subunit, ECF subfamily [Chthoniobacter flavus Ellin428]|uniref:RNA polymerase sigma factor n=1 Tax=Chthoniobacter flavus Ellin428 TaxID=497964 RepID=B4D056_9BACT|nr:sigma-70 family RNA polymerase sigma factor [Chthoniobacter flavus]EDY20370.1 RNA polymerase, sigma-24 subunit, ECF subfamily [Chthoniobacter flavus Ellin428]TCO94262.1 RNA polymerase sigma-70 factor (ECF subfamily) [Chthoniobacter flavus]
MIPPPTDAETIHRQLEALHDESFAWALVCAAYQPSEAEDILQMTYLKILDGSARYEGRSAFKTWLFGVIRLTALAHRRRTLWGWMRRASVEEAAAQPAHDPAPDAATARGETIRQVQEACLRLPGRQREVLMLVFHHSLGLDEAATVMGVSPGSARKHYQRAKESLRASLGRTFAQP